MPPAGRLGPCSQLLRTPAPPRFPPSLLDNTNNNNACNTPPQAFRGDSDDGYGYRPRRRRGSPPPFVDPYAKIRAAAAALGDPREAARQMQEQQLRARQLVLQQQAASAVAAASKVQRELYIGNLVRTLSSSFIGGAGEKWRDMHWQRARRLC